MALDNIDDLFSEQPLKRGDDIDTNINDGDVENLKKNLLKDEYKNAISERKFGLKKIVYNIKEFIVNVDIKYYFMILKIATVVLLLLFSYFMIIQVFNKIRGRNALKIDLVQPKTFVNNANNIYIDYPFYIDGSKNNLLKVQIDTLSTKFYFKRSIDRDVFTPVLIDENGYYYIYDYDYDINGDRTDDIVAFEGLRSGIENFRLIFVKDNNIAENTIDNVYFDFKMAEPIFKTPVKYYDNPFEIDVVGNSFNLDIESLVFSSAKSELYFDVEYKDNKEEYDFSLERIAESIYLTENGFKIPFNLEASSADTVNISDLYNDDSEIVIGKLAFEVLKNLNSKITIGFDNFHRIFRLNKELDVKNLLLGNITDKEVYELDHYTVYFEGAKKYDNLLVLVGHCVDENYVNNPIITVETDENGEVVEKKVWPDEPIEPNRVEMIVDATLYITLPDGSIEKIEGEPIRNRLGTDIKFQSNNINDAISNNMRLVVNKITVVEEGNEYNLNLKEADTTLNSKDKEYLEFVEKAVTDRLKYKSNELLFSQLTSFSDEVLEDPYLSRIYAPIALDNRANYAVDIKNYSIDDRGNFVCNVTEEWYGRVENVATTEYNRHHIIVSDEGGEMKVIYDKIVKE